MIAGANALARFSSSSRSLKKVVAKTLSQHFRAFTGAVSVEQRREHIDRIGQLVAEKSGARVIISVSDVAVRRYRMGDLQVPIEPVSDRHHRVVERLVFTGGILVALSQKDGNAETAQDR